MPAVSTSSPAPQFGPNEWLVEEMYEQFLADPSSVDPAWHDFFADYKPTQHLAGNQGSTATKTAATATTTAPSKPTATAAAAAKPATTSPTTPGASYPQV